VTAMNEKEAAIRADFARACGDDTAMLETSPCLDADSIFARVAWLAYLSRHDPRTHGGAFMREWLRIGQYIEYCGRTREYLVKQHHLEGDRARSVHRPWRHLAARLDALREITRPDAEAVIEKAPAAAGAAMAGARFTRERQAVVNVIGNLEPGTAAQVLDTLADAARPDLAAFARARQR